MSRQAGADSCVVSIDWGKLEIAITVENEIYLTQLLQSSRWAFISCISSQVVAAAAKV